MPNEIPSWLFDRRSILVSAATAFCATFPLPRFHSSPARAAEGVAVPSAAYHAIFGKIAGSRVPEERAVTVELPEIAENGNIVPYKITVDHPMEDGNFVSSIHLLSTANPQPHVATFHLTLLSGKAAVAGRMRLAKTQDVVVLAELNDGRLLIGKRAIGVTIGGCEN